MIRMEKVTKEYDGFEAVKSLSLTVEKGELFVLLGPSGCGKSTTLRLLNKMVERSSGEIYIEGENIDSFRVENLRRKMGYVIQSTGLFPHMDVAANIATVPELLKWDKKKTAARTLELLELVGLNPSYLKKRPRELSGGEAQRVGVARALAADPHILLMDEPFGAVDPLNRVRIQKEFRAIQQKLQKTVLFVTHDVEEALLLGDRILIMRDGEIVQLDTPENMIRHPQDAFVREFLGGEGVLSLLQRFSGRDYREEIAAEGEALSPDCTLKEALSAMLLRGTTRVPLSGGSLSLEGILRAMRGDRA